MSNAATVLTRGMRNTCIVRVGKPEDVPFVVDTWTKRGYRGERMREATMRVRALIARPTSRLIVAHVPDDVDAMLGWAVLEVGPLCLHYIYVRSAARRQGVARAIMREVACDALEYSRACELAPKSWTLNEGRAKT
jgi:GNAT superfamily N-acetyltransferase